MKIEKYSEAWLTGFAEETAEMGLNEEGAKDLLKLAAATEFKDRSEFREGFEKEAAGLGTGILDLLKNMWGSPAKATLSTLGTLGAGAAGYYGGIRPYVGMGPYERQVQKLRDAVDYGLLDEDQMLAATRMTAMDAARRRARAAGSDL